MIDRNTSFIASRALLSIIGMRIPFCLLVWFVFPQNKHLIDYMEHHGLYSPPPPGKHLECRKVRTPPPGSAFKARRIGMHAQQQRCQSRKGRPVLETSRRRLSRSVLDKPLFVNGVD